MGLHNWIRLEGHPGARGQAGGAGRTAGHAGEDLVLF